IRARGARCIGAVDAAVANYAARPNARESVKMTQERPEPQLPVQVGCICRDAAGDTDAAASLESIVAKIETNAERDIPPVIAKKPGRVQPGAIAIPNVSNGTAPTGPNPTLK